MEVGKSNIFKVLDGTIPFILPVYQRTCSRNIENCAQLWRDIVAMQTMNRTGHFAGSIVNIAEQTMPSGVRKDRIIDGQQRLTTLTLLLLALRDYAAKHPAGCNMPQSKCMKCLKMSMKPARISTKSSPLYIAYKYDTNFVDVVVQKDGLKLMINMDCSEIDDPQNLCKDSTDTGAWGNGNAGIFSDTLGNLDAVHVHHKAIL